MGGVAQRWYRHHALVELGTRDSFVCHLGDVDCCLDCILDMFGVPKKPDQLREEAHQLCVPADDREAQELVEHRDAG